METILVYHSTAKTRNQYTLEVEIFLKNFEAILVLETSTTTDRCLKPRKSSCHEITFELMLFLQTDMTSTEYVP